MPDRTVRVRMTASLSGSSPDRDWRAFPAGSELDVEDWEADELVRGAQVAVEIPGRQAVAAREKGTGDALAEPEPVAEVPAETEPEAGASVTAGTPEAEISPVTEVSPLAETAGTAAGQQLPGTPPPPEPAQEPPPEPVQEPPPELAQEPPPAPAEAAPLPSRPPSPHASKQHWIDYAVTRGEDPVTAAAMAKADLMSKYGGRL